VKTAAALLSVAMWLTLAGCGGGGGGGGGTVVVEDRFFATWEIQSATVGPLDCQSAGASEVDMDLVNTDTGARFVDRFACTDYQGTSELVDVGTFDVLLNLTDPTGAVLSQAHVGTENVSTAGTIDLGHYVFTLD
jgi:hypothetical protein